jgi:hypothetical protein
LILQKIFQLFFSASTDPDSVTGFGGRLMTARCQLFIRVIAKAAVIADLPRYALLPGPFELKRETANADVYATCGVQSEPD